jgi:hypothetical protein
VGSCEESNEYSDSLEGRWGNVLTSWAVVSADYDRVMTPYVVVMYPAGVKSQEQRRLTIHLTEQLTKYEEWLLKKDSVPLRQLIYWRLLPHPSQFIFNSIPCNLTYWQPRISIRSGIGENYTPLRSNGHSFWLQIKRSGFDSRHYQILWEVVGLQRGPLSL